MTNEEIKNLINKLADLIAPITLTQPNQPLSDTLNKVSLPYHSTTTMVTNKIIKASHFLGKDPDFIKKIDEINDVLNILLSVNTKNPQLKSFITQLKDIRQQILDASGFPTLHAISLSTLPFDPKKKSHSLFNTMDINFVFFIFATLVDDQLLLDNLYKMHPEKKSFFDQYDNWVLIMTPWNKNNLKHIISACIKANYMPQLRQHFMIANLPSLFEIIVNLHALVIKNQYDRQVLSSINTNTSNSFFSATPNLKENNQDNTSDIKLSDNPDDYEFESDYENEGSDYEDTLSIK